MRYSSTSPQSCVWSGNCFHVDLPYCVVLCHDIAALGRRLVSSFGRLVRLDSWTLPASGAGMRIVGDRLTYNLERGRARRARRGLD